MSWIDNNLNRNMLVLSFCINLSAVKPHDSQASRQSSLTIVKPHDSQASRSQTQISQFIV